jgi:hypothetical protein
MKDDPLNRLKVKRGSELPWAKLNETDVSYIRELVRYRNSLLAEARTLRNEDIAKKFGVGKRTIDRILYEDGWGHVL